MKTILIDLNTYMYTIFDKINIFLKFLCIIKSKLNFFREKNIMDEFEQNRTFIQDVTEGWDQSEASDKELFIKAYEFAKEVHKEQYRDEGSPYITHIEGIIDILRNELNDMNYYKWAVVALHDVLEDSNTTYEELKSMFGELIAREVDLLTKRKSYDLGEYLKRMEDYEYSATIIKIKLADRLHNVRSLNHIIDNKREKVYKYIKETESYYLPLSQKYNELLYDKLVSELKNLKEKL